MEDLFTASFQIEGQTRQFAVHFQDDAYVFVSPDRENEGFLLRRHLDEWQAEGDLPAGSKDAAVAALEHYLLQQH